MSQSEVRTVTRTSIRRRRDEGQTAVEYAGLIAVVAAVVATLAFSGVGGPIHAGIGSAVCAVAGGGCPASGDGGDVPVDGDLNGEPLSGTGLDDFLPDDDESGNDESGIRGHGGGDAAGEEPGLGSGPGPVPGGAGREDPGAEAGHGPGPGDGLREGDGSGEGPIGDAGMIGGAIVGGGEVIGGAIIGGGGAIGGAIIGGFGTADGITGGSKDRDAIRGGGKAEDGIRKG